MDNKKCPAFLKGKFSKIFSEQEDWAVLLQTGRQSVYFDGPLAQAGITSKSADLRQFQGSALATDASLHKKKTWRLPSNLVCLQML